MKLEAKIQYGRESAQFLLDIPGRCEIQGEAGDADLLVDGEAVRAEWAGVGPGTYSLRIQGHSYRACVWKVPISSRGQTSYHVTIGTQVFDVEFQDLRSRRHGGLLEGHEGPADIPAPMPGRIVKVLVLEGDRVTPGQGLLVIEAMKMQNEVRATRAGRIEKVHVQEGEGVESGSALLRLA